MTKTRRELLGGLIIFIVCAILLVIGRIVLNQLHPSVPIELTEEERASIERFELDRQNDSARQQLHWDSLHAAWQADRDSRQYRRLQREKAYADSQRVWARRREEWAYQKQQRQQAAAERQRRYDSIRATYPQKLPSGSVVDVNSADTVLLKQIPGIGSVNARRIVERREALGGFINPSQIAEIDGLPHGITSWFRVSGGTPRRINLNRADFKTIVHHPYISYEQTKAIVNFRQRIGKLRGWEDLIGCGLFSDSDIARISPYVTF